jgi:hypothetical protein
VKIFSGSTSVTESFGSRRFSVRTQIVPAKPPPTTTIRPEVWARATNGAKSADPVATKRRRPDRRSS